ncbi:zf-HC2 domain-containing protein [Streptomyces sp. UNOB3_S3]|uniref:zf-HC2 domain-containing protein n=1 Tax=Streptomyces sp. UNOB3_S3 TaxID=2871682 RepID=UPI001E63185D|nr:zf-HC2 domain-containing protein [Streptomyces sp. UNOB3_S3]MCC3775993.1 zf-HC2 domain-containing protein [Streptomyces sp. UNOB3_S3]
MTTSGGQSPAEHHLGDRLAALVDGELGHDSRERVLAHLATCWTCKAEADAQRRLKNVFAEAAPPPLSDSLLARLQGLPGGGTTGGPGGPPAPSGDEGADGIPAVGRAAFGAGAEAFGLLPAVGPQPRDRGFRTHPVGQGSGSRGRRFAFAAAGAVSLAAIALAGAQPLETPVASRQARGDGNSAATSSLGSVQGVPLDQRDLGRTQPAAQELSATFAAPLAAGVTLLRPSGARLLPPMVRKPATLAAQPQAKPPAPSAPVAPPR